MWPPHLQNRFLLSQPFISACSWRVSLGRNRRNLQKMNVVTDRMKYFNNMESSVLPIMLWTISGRWKPWDEMGMDSTTKRVTSQPVRNFNEISTENPISPKRISDRINKAPKMVVRKKLKNSCNRCAALEIPECARSSFVCGRTRACVCAIKRVEEWRISGRFGWWINGINGQMCGFDDHWIYLSTMRI